MDKKKFLTMLTGTALSTLAVFSASNARADESTSAEIRALKAELQRLERKVEDQSRQSHKTQAVVEQVAAQQVYTKGPLPGLALCPPNKLCYKGITFTPGGFVALEGVYREHGMASDIGTPFGSIPFRNGAGVSASANGTNVSRLAEGRFSARQSRISGLVEGQVDANTKLSAYGEFDFLGAAQTANSNESNSYTPRIRHLYGTLDRTDLGLHVLAGQTWSLATMFASGLQVRKENIPLTIDAQYVPGFVWARQAQIRVTKDLAPNFAVAVSAENPQETESGALPTAFGFSQPATGGGLFNSANSLSTNHVPDFIAKAAWDPTFGDRTIHIEGFGMLRDFSARSGAGNQDVVAGSGGGSILVPVLPKLLDVQFSGAAGSGLGRYGTSGIADFTVSSTGAVKPISEFTLLAGATLHALPSLDVYAYAGMEQATKNYTPGTTFGYGNPAAFSNAGCYTSVAGSACGGQNRSVRQITGGLWDTIYQGPYGQVRAGAQYSFTQRQIFADALGRAPTADENIVLTTLRYYPF